jgi:hypothetical protein
MPFSEEVASIFSEAGKDGALAITYSKPWLQNLSL